MEISGFTFIFLTVFLGYCCLVAVSHIAEIIRSWIGKNRQTQRIIADFAHGGDSTAD